MKKKPKYVPANPFPKGIRVQVTGNSMRVHFAPVGAVGTVIGESLTGNMFVRFGPETKRITGQEEPYGWSQSIPTDDLKSYKGIADTESGWDE